MVRHQIDILLSFNIITGKEYGDAHRFWHQKVH